MNLKEYLIGVTGIVLICAILSCAIPNGKNAKIIQGILKLSCLIAIMSPLLYLFQYKSYLSQDEGKYPDFFSDSVIQADNQFIKYYSELNVLLAADALANELLNKYAVSVDVKIDWAYDAKDLENTAASKIKITRIHIKPKTEIIEKLRIDMWEYLTNKYCSEVLIE